MMGLDPVGLRRGSGGGGSGEGGSSRFSPRREESLVGGALKERRFCRHFRFTAIENFMVGSYLVAQAELESEFDWQ